MKHFKLMKGVLACLLSLALVLSCFTTVTLKAADTAADSSAAPAATAPTAVAATYYWAKDSIQTDSAAVAYVLKAKSGNSIKAGAKCVELTQDKDTKKYVATMAELGIKKPKKDVYLYVCDKAFETAGTSISANLEIKAPAAKKVAGTVDYTKADGDDVNVISATATDASKKAIANPDIWWSATADGTYYQVNSEAKTANRKYSSAALKEVTAPDGFDGITLKEMLEKGGTIYIKMAGADGATGTAQFGSSATKVKIAKQAKAPAVKIDVKKDTIGIKNGFDFGIAVQDETTKEYSVAHWFTILPNLKGATVKGYAESVVPTNEFTPLGKKDTNAGKKVTDESGDHYSYTAYKFKAFSIETLLEKVGLDEKKCTIAIRKSATEKKPASAASYIEISVQAGNPVVYTKDNVKGEYLVATGTNFEKKGITLGTVVPFPGSISGEDNSIATTGYSDSFEVGKAGSGETIVDADKAGSSYEFAILQQKDLVAEGDAAVDWSTIGWKKFDPAKTKLTSKLKTKYNLLNGTKVTAQISTESGKAEASASGETIPAKYSSVKTFIVIRRAGDKSGARASAPIYLYVAKENKDYNIYSTIDNGEEAYKYTIKFAKYQKVGDTYKWDLASDVEDVSVWMAPTTTKYVALPEVTGAKLVKATASTSGDTVTGITANTSASGAITVIATGDNKGKYEISTSGASTATFEYIAVHEYANVTVKQVVSGDTSKEVIIFQQKDGKLVYNNGASASGEGTLFVADNFSISGGAVPSVSGYTITNGTPSNSGEVTFESGSGATTANVTKAVNSADEIVIVIPYTAKKQYKLGGLSLDEIKVMTFVSGTLDDDKVITAGTDVVFTLTPTDTVGDNPVYTVTYKVGTGAEVAITANAEGKYTIPGSAITGDVAINAKATKRE